MWRVKALRRQRAPGRGGINEALWRRVISRFDFLRALRPAEQVRLRQLTQSFLGDKQISGTAGLQLTDEMRTAIAAQACLLILNLDLDYFRGWVEVIIYPGDFRPRREYTDEDGVVHVEREMMQGEAWLQGPVILSLEAADSQNNQGVNVVIHEFAHKLDMLNGEPNGFPPLHGDMNRAAWARDFSEAYKDFCDRVDREEDTKIDPYAAESPAEFFAVLSEVFFESPQMLKRTYSEVYRQLSLFYRQDPAKRMIR
ncbi:MAG TPA: M90 family metallopeptidase [Burkholderiales bacterium]|nr:M90 family metallopeptidase [Burkholderiales bacterium]